ncbi:MAG: hypothetical protein HC781_11725 [Leptolyngbyaceae cyanobacterium CSU_1_4]|nr:hypothetical protein [Leptolyngbyaceae cyanobacterium CSU_1_4]
MRSGSSFLSSFFLSTFIGYFVPTAIGVTAVVSQATGLEIATGIPQQIGALGGVLVGGVGVYFNRSVAVMVPFLEQEKFLTELEALLMAMGYQRQAERDGIKVYARSGIRNGGRGECL